MVHDRDTGKPKGYGFIEYADVQTADLAIKNLNGFELSGRPLRVDSAAGGDRSAEEISSLQQTIGTQEESMYGAETDPSKAPEAISRCVASLPPEKMFELMKQMKEVVSSNPAEVRNMLTENPQLAYALLQAQVVMRIVDPQAAIAMLHRETPATVAPFHQKAGGSQPTAVTVPNNFSQPPPMLPPQSFNRPPPPVIGASANVNLNVPPPMSAFGVGPPPPSDITLEEQQNAELLMQVMQLKEEDIAMLPPGDREKVIELRNQLKRTVK